jgi:hypothetical protein
MSFESVPAQLRKLLDMRWKCVTAEPLTGGWWLVPQFLWLMVLVLAWLARLGGAAAQDDARMRQLRLLCAQLSGDLSDPGGIAAFQRCLNTHDPLAEIRRDNNIGGGSGTTAADRPGAKPPPGFGHNSRRTLADGVQRFATRDGRLFYVIDRDGKLWRGKPATKEAHAIDENVAAIELIDDANILTLGTDGRLWRRDGDAVGRALVGDKVASFQAMGTLVYIRGSDGKLWRETGNAGSRDLVDQQVTSFQAIDPDRVYVLSNDGQLWRENRDARDRKAIAGTVTAFQYVADGDTTYVLTRDGTLWRQQGDKGKPEQVDHGVAAFQVLDLHLAYVLGKDGRLWQELGNRDQAMMVDFGLLAEVGRAAFQVIDAQHIYILGNDYKLWAETMPVRR